jgi:multidrug efflux pump subunit AcrA (membrane-fusion protein)
VSDVDITPKPVTREGVHPDVPAHAPNGRRNAPSRIRIVPILITLCAVALAAPLSWAMWDAYMGSPWTRDGTVRAYVVTMAPEVAGRIVELPVADNQLVHKSDLLMVIDPTDYAIAVDLAEAARHAGAGQCGQCRAGGPPPRAVDEPRDVRGAEADLRQQRPGCSRGLSAGGRETGSCSC